MKTQLVLQLVLTFTAGTASALPAINVGALNDQADQIEKANCQRNSQSDSLRELIHKVGIIGEKDEREVLSRNRTVVGFSAAEEEQAMRCLGKIVCPKANGGRGTYFSAGAICAPNARKSGGDCAADRLATAAHGFVEARTGKLIDGLGSCEFINYSGHRSKIEVSDVTAMDPSIEMQNPRRNPRADKIVVRLKNQIPKCDPYDLDTRSVPPNEGKVVVISYPHSDQLDPKTRFNGSEPLAYNCEIINRVAPGPEGASLLKTDCDVHSGGSGSFALTRNSSNRLSVSGIIIQSNIDKAEDFKPYDNKYNMTGVVGVNGDFLQMAADPSASRSTQYSENKPAKIHRINLGN